MYIDLYLDHVLERRNNDTSGCTVNMTMPASSKNTPNQLVRLNISPTTTTLKIAAVNGSASANVVADDDGMLFKPYEYNMYAKAVVNTPIYTMAIKPDGVNNPSLLKTKKNGSSNSELITKTIATASSVSIFATIRLLPNEYVANIKPPHNANKIPNGWIITSSLFKNNNAQPMTAKLVATNHCRVGRVRKKIDSNNPVKIGELPMVTTVPTATPVKRTEVKNEYWKSARARETIQICFHGQLENLNLPRKARTTIKTTPPIAKRSAATTNESTVSGTNVSAVPVVPHKIPPHKTMK